MEFFTTYVLPIALFAIGVLFIVKGGDWFVDASSAIAKFSGIPRFIIGATIVSVATTLPEMIVSIMAATEGKVDMAIGNAVGSVTANTGLILALSLVCIPMVMKRGKFLFKGILLLATMTLLWIFSIDNALTWVEGIILFVIFGLFIWENIREAKKGDEESEKVEFTKKDIWKNIGLFVIGAAGIVIGSRLLVDNGSLIATMLGVPENIIALTMIAIGTSLPELVTAITSIVKKEASLSVGNVLGANIIDAALILPICAFISGGTLPISAQNIMLDIPASLIVAGVVLLPSFFTQKFSRWQGILMMILYAAYLGVVCFAGIF